MNEPKHNWEKVVIGNGAWRRCNYCNGSGPYKPDTCPNCYGEGYYKTISAPSHPQDPRDEALRVAREALGALLERYFDLAQYWDAEKEYEVIRAREALRQIKELMGEK